MASWQGRIVNSFFKLYSKFRSGTDIDVILLRNNIESLARWSPGVKGITQHETLIRNIPALELQNPEWEQRHILLYLHGGAYNLCSYNTHKRMVSFICRAAGIPALLINYRLAPEHPYPAALDDAVAAYQHVLNAGYSKIFIAGDSAGGGLALATLFRIRDNHLRMPDAAVFLSPWLDLTLSKWHEQHDAMLHKDQLDKQARNYYTAHDPADPSISPLNGRFENLPPILLQVSTSEVLYNEAMLCADQMERQGVPVTLQLWDDQVHVWQAYSIIPEAREAISRIGEFIRKHRT